jgi:hypothetical protein
MTSIKCNVVLIMYLLVWASLFDLKVFIILFKIEHRNIVAYGGFKKSTSHVCLRQVSMI